MPTKNSPSIVGNFTLIENQKWPGLPRQLNTNIAFSIFPLTMYLINSSYNLQLMTWFHEFPMPISNFRKETITLTKQ